MKIKIFKKEKNFKKEKENLRLSMNHYWRLAALFVFAVLILCASFGYYLFRQMSREPKRDAGGAGGQVETVKKERIEKVLEYFSQRKEKSDQIQNSPAPLSDPSL